MGIFTSIFKGKSASNKPKTGVEDFVSLTRVYFQAVLATQMGITNIRVLPDLANFKRLFKIQTQGGKLGLAEKSASRKMLMQDYEMSEDFFKEINHSIRVNCHSQNDITPYLYMYQGFSNDLMMLVGTLMQWKLRMPSVFKNTIFQLTQQAVHKICTKLIWKKDDIHKTAANVRQMKERLGYSEAWMTEYSFRILLLAKKEPRHKKDKEEK
jgi:hypothetical protein